MTRFRREMMAVEIPVSADGAARLLASLWNAEPDKSARPFRRFRREVSRATRNRDPAFVLDLARSLKRDHGLPGMANELLAHHRGAFSSLDRGELEDLGEGIDSWWRVDSFGRLLAGPAWLAGQISDETVMAWAKSEDLWWRRAALVCTVALNVRSQGGYGDTKRTLMICEKLVSDHEDMVVKAMSWALRELVWHDSKAVRAFLKRHEAELAARVKREVRNKIETGLKNPRKKK